MSLAPSAEPTSEWRTFDISEVVGRTNINYGNTQFSGISEARDILFVTGRAAPQQPGIWWSADGMTWHRGDVPRAPDPYGFTVRDVVDAGPRFVAVADGGLAEGSGIFATAIYVSEDGRTWRNAESIPAVESGGHSSLVRSGDRLFAIGTSVWASGDGGLTWAEHVSADDWAGRAFDGDARGDVILAAGQAGIGDTVEGPGYAWVSTDSGQTWRRALVDDGSVLSSAAVTPDGKLVVARTSSVRTSIDNGVTWPISEVPLPCCGSELVTTASGLLAVMHAEAEPSRMAISEDGITWEPAGAAPVPVRDAAWGPRFGLVVVGQTTVGIGPDRYR
jgi:hypothetical protein